MADAALTLLFERRREMSFTNSFPGRTVRKAEDETEDEAESRAQKMNDPKAGDEIDTTEDVQRDSPEQTRHSRYRIYLMNTLRKRGSISAAQPQPILHLVAVASTSSGRSWRKLVDVQDLGDESE